MTTPIVHIAGMAMAIRTNIARKQARKDQGSVTHTCYALGNDVAQDRQVD
eukprot:COSAG06_NODE_57082_length_281_cov_2.697802_1_plen_49_part_01